MSIPAARLWWTGFYRSRDTIVFHVDLTSDLSNESHAFSLLDEPERVRWHKFAHKGARRRFALCRAALRTILCNLLRCHNHQLSFDYTRHNKPFALVNGSPAEISFNLSHSGRHGLIALAQNGRLGVDIEERASRRDFDRLIEAAFGKNEQAALNEASHNLRIQLFYKLWTTKEALIKALGTGMSYDPADFEAPESMRLGGVSSTFRFSRIPEIKWQVLDISDHRFAAAVAHEVSPPSHSISDLQIYERLAGSESPVS